MQEKPRFMRTKFSKEEDNKLIELVGQFGENWLTISTFMPGRNPKGCKDRYVNYLTPNKTNGKNNPTEEY